MMKASNNCDRETCSLCSKYIYKHQPVVVCSMDGNIYHGKCLGFCKDTCFHIQSGTIPDWICPTCSREVFPFYDDIPDLSYVKCICYNCRLFRGESGSTLSFNPFNLRGIAHKLISSYLSNRKQFVYYDNECYSADKDISVGVPQGSVLGPLFFILYVNGIISCAESSVEFVLFADDTNIFIYAPTTEELYCRANKVLRQLKSYIDSNYLHINLKKSKYIHFRSNRQNTISNTVFYDNFKLEQVPKIKFLGIIISETLVWNEHIKSTTRKLSKITGSLYKIRRCIPKAMLRNVYYALVNSQLMYGISIWGSGGSIFNLRCLFSVQKKCMRSLFRVKRISILCPGHTKSKFTAYKILTVHNLYFYSVLTSIFSSLYSCPPQPIVIKLNHICLKGKKHTLFYH